MSHYIIGKVYTVPCVRVNEWHGYTGWLPVIGPMHSDHGPVNFPHPHYHIDWRFAPKRVTVGRLDWGTTLLYGAVVQCPNNRGNAVIEARGNRRLKCQRDLPPYPIRAAKWLPQLARDFADCKIVDGKCPHRGIPVSAMIRDGDVLTCPGHGLRFSIKTGALIRTPLEMLSDC